MILEKGMFVLYAKEKQMEGEKLFGLTYQIERIFRIEDGKVEMCNDDVVDHTAVKFYWPKDKKDKKKHDYPHFDPLFKAVKTGPAVSLPRG